jgi:hypothetical protein
MNFLKKFSLLILSIITVSLTGCDKNESSPTEEGTSKISVKLMDDPGDYDNVFIDVQDVMVKVNDDSEGEGGWQSLGAINTGVYDLLELTGGINVLLVDGFEVPSGTLNQIRLVLGEDNSVVIDGETFPLNTPSAQQSGLKIKVNQELEAGFNYTFLLDFDVDQSIIVAGNSGNINLKPVINATAEFASGIIQGAVTPFDFQVTASVAVDGEVISSYANENGIFTLNGVPAGTYDVTITPDPASGYASVVVSGVVVVNGVVTNLETIELQLEPAYGSITGIITNVGVMASASVMVGTDVVSADTNESGMFLLENIPAGIYTVTITPTEGSGLTAIEIADVEVIADATADLGSITLE